MSKPRLRISFTLKMLSLDPARIARFTRDSSLLFAWLVLGLSVLTSACDGPVGPQGEAGPQGERGPQGEQGERGVANVTTIEIEFDRSQVQLNGNHAQITFGVNEIDVDVVDNGSVVAFLNTSVGWTALPEEFMFDETIITGYVRVGYSYVVGQFVLTYSKNGQNLERSDLPDGVLKIVVTSPG